MPIYSCPKHGVKLEKVNGKHACPIDGEVVDGPEIDGAARGYAHMYYTMQCESLGWAYTLTGKPAYAERVHEILLEYASFYRDLPVQGNKGTVGGRIHWQTLTEAMALLRICIGFDRTRKAPCYSDADRETIASQLLRPMVDTIRPYPRPDSNWQAWHNSAIGCAGYVLNDGDLADWAVNGEAGFLYQREKCIKGSGIWYEESPTYHLFALEPYTYFFEAALRADTDLYGDRVKLFYDAPLRYLLPDMTFPPLNNSDRRDIRDFRHLYEVAYRRFQNPQYLPLLDKRDTPLSLVWGVDTLPEPVPRHLNPGSTTLPEDGLAVLRNASDNVTAFLDYSGKGTVHTHPAKLGLLFYALGDVRFVDPGRLSYNNPLQGTWYAQTVAHNAPVINAASQAPAEGYCTAFATTDAFQIARAACEGAYPTVSMDRTLLQHKNYWIDIVQVFGGTVLTMDLPLHLFGTLTGLPDQVPAEPLGTSDGYELLQEVHALGAPAFTATLKTGGADGIHITFDDGAGTAYLANGPGPVPTQLLPVLLRRQEARNATFVSVYEVFKDGSPPAPVTVQHSLPLRIGVGGVTLELGSTTIVETGGQRYFIGEEGVTGTRPLPPPAP